MADVGRPALDCRIEWIDGSGVTTPELSACWARYEIWIGGRCVTQVDEGRGTFRRSVFGSVYSLAEWVAENWWALTTEVRPSAVPTDVWRWANVRREEWLRRHNMRAAGDGMAWPDLTIVPEGSVTRFVWHGDPGADPSAVVSFNGDGQVVLPSQTTAASLAGIVERVVTRLEEQGIPDTTLTDAWRAVQEADDEETAFCRAAARLGLDPYDVEGDATEALLSLEQAVPADVLADFLDTVDPAAIPAAVSWLTRGRAAAARRAARITEDLGTFQAAVEGLPDANHGRPWRIGYAMATRIREVTAIDQGAEFDPGRWVGKASVSAEPHGLQGVGVATVDAHCAVALPADRPASSIRFSQARILGKALAHQDREYFVLSTAHADEEKLARAFAAELLAPARGINRYLDVLGSPDDSAIEAIASRYKVSPFVIRHQYENQILEGLV